MPSMNATTTAVFTSLGISATDIYAIFNSLVGTSISFGLWLIQVSWPFLLVIGFIYLMWRIAHSYSGIGKSAGTR